MSVALGTAEEAPLPLDPQQAARAAQLHYVHDTAPGLSRRRSGKGFAYRDADGSPVRDRETLARIRSLAIPPAWTEVWICRDPNGHLQAVGRDDRGRKQYRYHPRWRAVRDDAKFAKMAVFGSKLPEIRRRVEADLALPGLPRRKVLAAVVRLLERTMARVGNEEYAKANRSFGLTTLRNRHAHVAGSRLVFDFRGKHGIQHHIDLKAPRLSRLIRRLQDIPGQVLFQYLDEDGTPHAIGSEDVNEYLHEITGEEITAKDFRTWAATNLAAIALAGLERYDTKTKAKRAMLETIESVAKRLGNTPSICRKCYIHPAVFDGYLDGTLTEALKARAEAVLAEGDGLTAEEAAVIAFLDRQLTQAPPARPVRAAPRRPPRRRAAEQVAA